MGRVIDSSLGECAVSESIGMIAGVKFRFQVGWKAKKYVQKQIVSIHEIDRETYRSAGGAAVGAIVGGVLTGGIGLLAGAALGGRRRKSASYLIHFDDGEYAAIEVSDGNVIRVLDHLAQKQEVRRQVADSTQVPVKT
ncbi:hypothetical protein [Pseudogemmobacter sonorensis]|uniref:hypothetical protein n=1 Tax=Pseudogemmobacter sonorensis TaxID=2989681 RepID=UPI003687AFA7